MSNEKKSTNILGIEQPKQFTPYETEDGWTVVLPGEALRRGIKVPRALTKVEIALKSKENLEICLKHLEESDRRFSMVNSNPWDWKEVLIKGNNVRFGVVWYDLNFFETNREAYSNPAHANLYSNFGATVDDFKIEHFLINDMGETVPLK